MKLSKVAKGTIGLCLSLCVLSACTSGQIKARKAQRDAESQSSKLYCDFINGEQYPDVEVQMNLEMAKRCDADKSMTITSYRSPSEAVGIVYCCGIKDSAKGAGNDTHKESGKDAKAEKH